MTPHIVYTFEDNPNFRRSYTIADVTKPGRDVYGHILGDLMTLGRDLPEYEEWAQASMLADLNNLNHDAKSAKVVNRYAIDSEKALEKVAIKLKEKSWRFIDAKLNLRFNLSN